MLLKWVSILSLALLVFVAGVDVAAAKKARSGHAAKAGASKKASTKHTAGKQAPATRESRSSRDSRTKGKVSSRESSRREKHARGRVAKSGRRSRHIATSRRGRNQRYASEIRAADPVVSRPSSSGIPSERATEIQKALIKAGYMDGPPSGQYDDATIQAIRQYQSANGLPQTGMPSAVLLKKLGVPKRSGDGYAVPVNTVSAEKKTSN